MRKAIFSVFFVLWLVSLIIVLPAYADSPELSNLIQTLEVEAGGGPQIIDSDVTLTCPGDPDFADWDLELTFIDWDSYDLIGVAASSDFSMSESGEVSYQTIVIGNAGFLQNSIAIIFNSNATCEILEQLIESLTYENTSGNQASTCSIQITFTDNTSGSSDPETISITVVAVNNDPIAVEDSYQMYEGNTLTKYASEGVLCNDTDEETESSLLTAILEGEPPLQADSFELDTDGSFTYTHDGSISGTVSFQYKLCDDSVPPGCSIGKVTITVKEINIPSLSDPVAKSITETAAILGASVNSDNGSAIIERGIVWSTLAEPTLQTCSGSKIKSGTLGSFEVNVTGLTRNTTYHYRGYAKNGEGISYTSDSTFKTGADYDFGDAPSSYSTKLSEDGARHALGSGLFLGTKADAENDGKPSKNADGDGDDEDGVVFSSKKFGPDTQINAIVSPSGWGHLNVWIDFDFDGEWNNGEEHLYVDLPVSTVITLPISAPAEVGSGKTYARFRFSSEAGLGPKGPANDGEVEDYQLILEGSTSDDSNTGSVLSSVSISPVSVNEGEQEVTLTGNVSDTGQLDINWGDGTGTRTSTRNSSGNFTNRYKYADGNATYTIRIKFIDSSNQVHSQSKQVTVNDVKPLVSLADSLNSVNTGAEYVLTLGAIDDPGDDEVSGYTIDWGDGSSPESYNYTEADTRSHTYDSSGTFTIRISLTDEEGTHSGAGIHSVTVTNLENGKDADTASHEDDDMNSGNDDNLGNETANTENSESGDGGKKTVGSSKRPSSGGGGGISGFGGSGLSSTTDSDNDDSSGGGVPIWLIVVPIIATVVIGVGTYFFLGSYLEWW